MLVSDIVHFAVSRNSSKGLSQAHLSYRKMVALTTFKRTETGLLAKIST